MRPVIAYHLVITTYGFWLPNDPRGSWSDFVRAWELQKFGPATRTRQRRSLANDPHDWKLRIEAKKHLARKPVAFSGVQARAVGQGFANYVAKSGCVIYACAIMPCHAHLVIARHKYSIEQIATLLKGAATKELLSQEIIRSRWNDTATGRSQLPGRGSHGRASWTAWKMSNVL